MLPCWLKTWIHLLQIFSDVLVHIAYTSPSARCSQAAVNNVCTRPWWPWLLSQFAAAVGYMLPSGPEPETETCNQTTICKETTGLASFLIRTILQIKPLEVNSEVTALLEDLCLTFAISLHVLRRRLWPAVFWSVCFHIFAAFIVTGTGGSVTPHAQRAHIYLISSILHSV